MAWPGWKYGPSEETARSRICTLDRVNRHSTAYTPYKLPWRSHLDNESITVRRQRDDHQLCSKWKRKHPPERQPSAPLPPAHLCRFPRKEDGSLENPVRSTPYCARIFRSLPSRVEVRVNSWWVLAFSLRYAGLRLPEIDSKLSAVMESVAPDENFLPSGAT